MKEAMIAQEGIEERRSLEFGVWREVEKEFGEEEFDKIKVSTCQHLKILKKSLLGKKHVNFVKKLNR